MSSKNNGELHKNHRERVRERFRKDGIASFEDHQILELLLFYSIKRSDTNPVAHRLLEHFGSLDKVLSAGISELMEVDGVGEKSAQFITTVAAVSKQSELRKLENAQMYQTIYVGSEKSYLDTAAAQAYFERYMWGCDAPDSAVIFINKDKRLEAAFPLSRGKSLSAEDIADEILTFAKNTNAVSVMLAHKHKSGVTEPSLEDIVTTKKIDSELSKTGLTLIEHFIVTDRVVTPFYDNIKEKDNC